MTAFIREAAERGFTEICFLDHLTITAAPRPMTMAVAEVPLYFQTVQRLKKLYSDRIAVKTGLEIEFHPRHTGLFGQLVNDFAFDVIGSSIHNLDGIDVVSGPGSRSSEDPSSMALQRRYLDYLEMMLEHDYFDIICHLDLLKKFGGGTSAYFEDRLAEILSKTASRHLTVEVNTSGYDHPAAEAYPSTRILHILKEACVAVTIGSDAHRPDEIGRHFRRALNMVQAAGFSHLAVFTARGRSEVPIFSYPISPQN